MTTGVEVGPVREVEEPLEPPVPAEPKPVEQPVEVPA